MSNDYKNKQANKFYNYSREDVKDGNSIFIELAKQLITIASVFIGLSAPVFIATDIRSDSNIVLKIILIISLSLFVISILLGLLQLFEEYRFLQKWGEARVKIANFIRGSKDSEENLLNKIVSDLQSELNIKSNLIYIIIQSISFIIAILLMIIFLSITIFTTLN